MNEFKGTPGPWATKDNGFYRMAVVDGIGNYLTYKAGTDRMDMHVLEANARLIAAAPDLLNAVQAFLRQADALNLGGWDWEDEIELAQQAAAKALGEKP